MRRTLMPEHRKNRRHAKVAYAALAVTDSLLAASNKKAARRARLLTKPLLMPALNMAMRSGPTGTQGRLEVRTSLAQAFSWGGDVALLGKSEPSFLAGVASFFGAHVSYIAAFSTARNREAQATDLGPKAAAATWLALAPLMATAAGKKDPKLRLPVAAYGGILATMFATSTMLDHSLPQSARSKIVAGTSLFLLSDSLLGIQEFLRRTPSPLLEGSVMATYTAGQWLIADGVATAATLTSARD